MSVRLIMMALVLLGPTSTRTLCIHGFVHPTSTSTPMLERSIHVLSSTHKDYQQGKLLTGASLVNIQYYRNGRISFRLPPLHSKPALLSPEDRDEQITDAVTSIDGDEESCATTGNVSNNGGDENDEEDENVGKKIFSLAIPGKIHYIVY